MLKVLVVDDSALFRKIITKALSSIPDVVVVGEAPNGKVALQKAQQLKPDLMTLDIEMPEMDGLAVLDALRGESEAPEVIVVSAVTQRGGRLTMQALQKGAFDFITKPDSIGPEESLSALTAELTPKVKALALRHSVRKILRGKQVTPTVVKRPEPAPKPEPAPPIDEVTRRMIQIARASRPEMVLIGVSTGGPNALSILLPGFPPGIRVPILIVQHMPPLFTQALAETLSAKCPLTVKEAVDGETVKADTIYIAPGGKQMGVIPGSDGQMTVQITDDPPENNCKPAVDYLFRSVATHYPGKAIAVILTGMGNDGTQGLRLLKRHGCFSIAQDEATSVVYGMPKAAVEAGLVDEVLPLESIAPRILTYLQGTTRQRGPK